MSEFRLINITNRNCIGLFLEVEDTFKDEIKTVKQGNDLLKKRKIIKVQLRTKIEGKRGKKNLTFNYHETKTDKELLFVKSFKDLLDIVDSIRLDIKEKLKAGESLRKKKVIDTKDIKEKETFLDKVEDFLKDKEVSARKSTMQNYETTLLTHSKELHNKEFSSITIKDIQKIVHYLIDAKRAPATVSLYARTLRAFFNTNKKYILIDFDDLELPEVDNKVDYTLSLDDTKKIIKVLREYSRIEIGDDVFYQYEEIKNIFSFSLTGRRINEILSLRFCDLNFEANSFKIVSTNTKGKKELDFEIDEYILNALKSQSRLRNIDLYSKSEAKIFTYTRETPRVHFQNILKALGLPKLRLHDIRHMLGTTLVQNGVPIQDISRMLGHSSITITEQRYAKTNKEQANRATNAFNSLMR